MKFAVIGYSGSGKSTMTKALGTLYNCPVLHLDTVQFLENWKVRDVNSGREIVKDFLENNSSWVIDGNYSEFYQERRLYAADQIIFFNFSRFRCLYQALRRYYKFKNKTRDDMADGCIEKMDGEFLWWILYKGRTKKRQDQYKKIIDDYHSKIVILKSRNDAEKFIKSKRFPGCVF